MENYTVYHLHSHLSNGVTNVDSVTKYDEYIDLAKEYGMSALGFSEHGSIFEWYHKKTKIEQAGMKYIHGIEAYLTSTLEDKIRDNYHCVLIARNYEGLLELNRLVSRSFNRKDNHFYYVPRISFEELFHTSDNIIVTSACIGGVYGKASKMSEESDDDHWLRDMQTFHDFMELNKHRCFLEVGHHIDNKQRYYNKMISDIHKGSGIPLIAGTDTHCLNKIHEKGRSILQKAKNIYFEGEDGWDLTFKSYDELIDAYKNQATLSEKEYLNAIENTNVLADMVEEYEIDTGTKYPHIYVNPEKIFREKVYKAIDEHPYALKNHAREELVERVEEELDVYEKTKSIDFMLLQTYLRDWEKANGIQCGYGRGSVSGSEIAYLLGVTNMDSMRFNLNFFRFLNPSRVTNADIDTDYANEDRAKVKEFILKDRLNLDNIRSAEIITFNTIALKGAVRDVCRALYKDSEKVNYMTLSNMISKMIDNNEEEARKNYPEVFEYVDIVNGTIVSIGTHPSGVLISDLNLDETVGLCSISTSEYPVSMLNMKELDALMYVKLDILGLDSIGIINETCKMAGIDRITPDNVDPNDEEVWKSIRDNTAMIFQWESGSAQQYIRKLFSDKTLGIAKDHNKNFSFMKWMSFGNGLIRPGCASFRDNVADGEILITGFEELDEFLSTTFGRIAMQEDIMMFLVKFCGYSDAESDTVRRLIAKKYGTEGAIQEIHDRFVSYSHDTYGQTVEKLEEIFPPIKQGILDATDYAFSWNHSDAYSFVGYIAGYLRYYYPYQFLTSALNIFEDKPEKTAAISNYAKRVGIQITMPKWGISRRGYRYDEERKVIAKGLGSIKYMSAKVADELYKLSQKKKYKHFIDLLSDINKETSADSRQLDILIKLDFFSDFGNQRELLYIVDYFNDIFKKGEAKQIQKTKVDGTPLEKAIKKYSVGVTKSGGVAKNYTMLDIESAMIASEVAIKNANLPDLPDIEKVRNFADVMGYCGYVSFKEEDRRKLYVLETYPLKRKSDGKQFGYSVVAKSIGSGIETRYSCFNNVFNRDPIKEGDIIYIQSYERDGQYFKLTSYKHI